MPKKTYKFINYSKISFLNHLKFFIFISLGFAIGAITIGAITMLKYPALFSKNIVLLEINQQKPSKNNIIAKGDNITIYESEMIDKLKSWGYKITVIPDNLKNILINEIAGNKAILREALLNKTQNDQITQQKLNRQAGKLLKIIYIEKYLSEAITEENLQSIYKQLTDKLIGKKEVKISHIVLKDKKEANYLYKNINQNNFKSFASKYSRDQETNKTHGELGYILEDNLPPSFKEKILTEKVGTILKPHKSKDGFHIIWIEDKRKALALPFEQAKENIKKDLSANLIKDYTAKLLKKDNFSIK